MKLRHYSLLLLALLVLSSCSSTTYFVVRHAEKLNATENSPLSKPGHRRARALAQRLTNENISQIFVSDKLRTQQTAAPTATLFHLEPTAIPQANTAQLITALKNINGRNVLVVRHSNEIHLIVNALSPSDTIAPIDDEFDNLFKIKRRTVFWQTDIRLDRLKYGAPSM